MAKNLIIGCASGYDYDKVKYWINSIQRSGFSGDIVLCVTNILKTDIEKIAAKGVQVMIFGSETANGYNSDMPGAPHVERFFYLWSFLKQCKENYRWVITTDVRDVVFQTNPDDMLNLLGGFTMMAADEGLKYKDEPWGAQNYKQCFGDFFFQEIKERSIYNVGVMIGHKSWIRDMMLAIFQTSMNRPIPVVDQAVYNFLMNQEWLKIDTFKPDNGSQFVVNLGTTVLAVEAGSGDLGMICKQNAAAMVKYLDSYLYDQPVIEGNQVLENFSRKPICIVHQYDRIPYLKEKMMDRFDD